MNLAALKSLLVDDLRGICASHHSVISCLEAFPCVALVPRVQVLREKFLAETRRQADELETLFERLDWPSTGGREAGARGLLEELHEAAARDSGAYPPIHGDTRVLSALWKLLHCRMGACRVAMTTAHVLESWAIEGALQAAWEQDRALDREFGELMPLVLRLACAETAAEADLAIGVLT
jgi:ferritin-like metal-binding protein YciE